MRLAIISDIHANIVALNEVLTSINNQKIDQVFCAGDLVGYAPFPNEVIELIRDRNIPTVMGNYDDGIGNMRFICGCDYKNEKAEALGRESITWTKSHTSEENKAFLRGLPKEIRLTLNGKRILIVHGSPFRYNEYITEDIEQDYAEKMLRESNCDILICGHTHIPFELVFGEQRIINVGSVGKPKHGDPRAVYAIIEISDRFSTQFEYVHYNYESVAKAIEESELPDEFAQLIRDGIG